MKKKKHTKANNKSSENYTYRLVMEDNDGTYDDSDIESADGMEDSTNILSNVELSYESEGALVNDPVDELVYEDLSQLSGVVPQNVENEANEGAFLSQSEGSVTDSFGDSHASSEELTPELEAILAEKVVVPVTPLAPEMKNNGLGDVNDALYPKNNLPKDSPPKSGLDYGALRFNDFKSPSLKDETWFTEFSEEGFGFQMPDAIDSVWYSEMGDEKKDFPSSDTNDAVWYSEKIESKKPQKEPDVVKEIIEDKTVNVSDEQSPAIEALSERVEDVKSETVVVNNRVVENRVVERIEEKPIVIEYDKYGYPKVKNKDTGFSLVDEDEQPWFYNENEKRLLTKRDKEILKSVGMYVDEKTVTESSEELLEEKITSLDEKVSVLDKNIVDGKVRKVEEVEYDDGDISCFDQESNEDVQDKKIDKLLEEMGLYRDKNGDVQYINEKALDESVESADSESAFVSDSQDPALKEDYLKEEVFEADNLTASGKSETAVKSENITLSDEEFDKILEEMGIGALTDKDREIASGITNEVDNEVSQSAKDDKENQANQIDQTNQTASANQVDQANQTASANQVDQANQASKNNADGKPNVIAGAIVGNNKTDKGEEIFNKAMDNINKDNVEKDLATEKETPKPNAKDDKERIIKLSIDDGQIVCKVCGHLNKKGTGVCEMCSNYLEEK